MAEYGMGREAAVDITSGEARGLLTAAMERKKTEMELLSIMNANAIGKMLFGGKKTEEGGTAMNTGTGKKKAKTKTAYWSGGRTSTRPDLSPNPKRPRLKELAEMEPQPLDLFALNKIASIDQGGR